MIDADAALGHAGKSELAQRFIRNDGDRIRQVQTPRFFGHGHAEAAVRILLKQFFRQALRFLAEDEHVVFLKLNIGITLVCLCRQIKKAVALVFFQHFIEVFMNLYVYEMPIIKAGAL